MLLSPPQEYSAARAVTGLSVPLGRQQGFAGDRPVIEHGPPGTPALHQASIEQHLEVDETMPLRKAHELVTDLEAEMRREVPAITSILTHIESEPATIERPASLDVDKNLELQLRCVAVNFPEILDIHDVFVTRRSTRMAGHADVRWHLWIVLAALGRLDVGLAAYAFYFPARALACAARKAVRHA